MKRRGFLGFLAGGAVAGPSMVKEAATQTLADLSLGQGLAPTIGGYIGNSIGSSAPPSQGSWAAVQLAKLVGRTAEQHAWHKQRTTVTALDPDLAGYRSMALHRKISLQRERDYERGLEGEKGYFEAAIAGWFD